MSAAQKRDYYEVLSGARSASAEEICARTIRVLRSVGAQKIYISNLGNRGAGRRLKRIMDQV